MEGYTCSYGHMMQDSRILDDVVLTVFRAPHSYTGEDVVEISCHGGRFLTQKILRSVFCESVRPAEAGEFTKRAFLNGKLSLTQAEAVADLIWADYPDEDIPGVDSQALTQKLTDLLSDMQKLMQSYDYGRILREGLHTVIAGKPNVGKSTLFNVLSGYERSIVTDIAGTTRDVVEEQIRIGGVILRLSDTAGVHGTDDKIEQIGVERSLASLDEADLILAVFDISAPLEEEDRMLLSKLPAEKTIVVYNKSDKSKKTLSEEILSAFSPVETVEISARLHKNIPALEEAVERFASRHATPAEDGMIANERQRMCLSGAISAISEALEALQAGLAYDAVTVSLDSAADSLLQLTGERVTEKVVDTVFSRFCVGK